MTNRGYSSSAGGYGPRNPQMRPNYNGYDQDRNYGQGGRPYGGQGQGQGQAQRPDQPEYYDRPSSGGGSGGSPPHDDYSFRPVDQTYR